MTGDARAHAPLPPRADGSSRSTSSSAPAPAPAVTLVGRGGPDTASSSMDDAVRRATSAVALASVGLRTMRRREAIAKRGLDIVGASAGLLLLAPLLAGVGVAIRLSERNPAMFRQRRAGRGGHPFRIYKFRTMRVGADAERADLRAANANEVSGGAAFKMTNDPRVTKIGRFLRRTSIDELPQLLNVLRGDMSLVGPRPHPYDDLAGYAPWHYGRLAVKPGITGIWQLRGRSDTQFDRWVEYDLEYIRTRSLWMDVRLMLLTLPAMLRQTGR